MAREKRWIVRPGDGAHLVAILSRMGEGEGAIAEGRVFLGRRRATRDEPVREGDEIRVGGAVRSNEGGTSEKVDVLFERDGLVACVKPAGIASVPDHAGAHSFALVVARTL